MKPISHILVIVVICFKLIFVSSYFYCLRHQRAVNVNGPPNHGSRNGPFLLQFLGQHVINTFPNTA